LNPNLLRQALAEKALKSRGGGLGQLRNRRLPYFFRSVRRIGFLAASRSIARIFLPMMAQNAGSPPRWEAQRFFQSATSYVITIAPPSLPTASKNPQAVQLTLATTIASP